MCMCGASKKGFCFKKSCYFDFYRETKILLKSHIYLTLLGDKIFFEKGLYFSKNQNKSYRKIFITSFNQSKARKIIFIYAEKLKTEPKQYNFGLNFGLPIKNLDSRSEVQKIRSEFWLFDRKSSLPIHHFFTFNYKKVLKQNENFIIKSLKNQLNSFKNTIKPLRF